MSVNCLFVSAYYFYFGYYYPEFMCHAENYSGTLPD